MSNGEFVTFDKIHFVNPMPKEGQYVPRLRFDSNFIYSNNNLEDPVFAYMLESKQFDLDIVSGSPGDADIIHARIGTGGIPAELAHSWTRNQIFATEWQSKFKLEEIELLGVYIYPDFIQMTHTAGTSGILTWDVGIRVDKKDVIYDSEYANYASWNVGWFAAVNRPWLDNYGQYGIMNTENETPKLPIIIGSDPSLRIHDGNEIRIAGKIFVRLRASPSQTFNLKIHHKIRPIIGVGCSFTKYGIFLRKEGTFL